MASADCEYFLHGSLYLRDPHVSEDYARLRYALAMVVEGGQSPFWIKGFPPPESTRLGAVAGADIIKYAYQESFFTEMGRIAS